MGNELNGLEIFEDAIKELKIDTQKLIAKSAIWVNPEIVNMLLKVKGNHFACWWTNSKRNDKYKNEDRRKYLATGEYTDDNTIPNTIVKSLTGLNVAPHTFRVCHIFDESRNTYNSKFFSSIPNLVLLPTPLFALEADKNIKAILKYKSYDLYKVKLSDNIKKPKGYDKLNWKNPMPFTPSVKKKVESHIKRTSCIKIKPKKKKTK